MVFDRRDFLKASTGAALFANAPADLVASVARAATPRGGVWDAGSVRHLLPTASDNRLLIKVSFNAPQAAAPVLRVGNTSVRGRMSDTHGEFWQFHATDLKPGRPHRCLLSAIADEHFASHGSYRLFQAPMSNRRSSECYSFPAPVATRP